MIRAVLTGRSTGRVLILIGSALYLLCTSVPLIFVVLYKYLFVKFFTFLVSWAWWDWPLTWLTNHRTSVLWHCWLGHVTRKIVRNNLQCVEWDLKLYYTIGDLVINPLWLLHAQYFDNWFVWHPSVGHNVTAPWHHYFPLTPISPNISTLWPVPNYTA